MPENIPILVGAVLTVLVLLGYLLGENNFLFRLATYIFIGVASGYVFVLVFYQVITPRLIRPLLSGSFEQIVLTLPPLVLSVLLVFKIFPNLSRLGNLSMAYLVGAGAAVAIGGAVLGTLITQARASIDLFDLSAGGGISRLLDGVFILVGTLSTLLYFSFSAKAQRGAAPQRPVPVRAAASVGQIFIAITLGSLFAGVFTASLTALIERLGFLLNLVRTMVF